MKKKSHKNNQQIKGNLSKSLHESNPDVIDDINKEYPFPIPQGKTEEEKLIDHFNHLFYNQFNYSGADYIRNRCLDEIDEIRIAKTNIIRDEKINEIIDAAYKSILDQLMSKLENSIAIKNDDLIYIPASFESLKNKIDEILPGIDIRFTQNLKGNPIWGSETNTNTTEAEQEIKKKVTDIITTVINLRPTSKGIKRYLQDHLSPIVVQYQNNKDPRTVLEMPKTDFIRLYLWKNGVEKLNRYKSFESFYRNIFLK